MFRITITLVFLFLITIRNGGAETTLLFIAEEYHPYEYKENGEAKGTDVDIIKEVCRRLNITPIFEFKPWIRALSDIKTGKADAIFSLFHTPERAVFLDYPTEALSQEQNIFVVHQESDKYAHSIDDMAGWYIGMVAGNVYGQSFDKADNIIRKKSHKNELLIYQLHAKNRLDAIVINELLFDVLVKKMVQQGQLIDPQFRKLDYKLEAGFLYVGFAKAKGEKSQHLAKQFTQELKQMREEGKIAEIMNKYIH